MVTAVYPGTFDPVTLGHLDILQRGSALFDEVIVAVAADPTRPTLFNTAERVAMFAEAVQQRQHVRVEPFSGLLVEYVKAVHAKAIIRGMRFVSDFEHEVQMALMNRRLSPEIETVLLAPSEEYAFLNATIVREVRIGPSRRFAEALVVPSIAYGVGACRGCAVETSMGPKRACTDGPVFDLLELL